MRHSPFHPEGTPQPPMPPRAASSADAMPSQPFGQSPFNDSLAPPHSAVLPAADRDRSTPIRLERMQQVTEKHIGPLAVHGSHDVTHEDRNEPLNTDTARTAPIDKPPKPAGTSDGQEPLAASPEQPAPPSPESSEGTNIPLEIPAMREYAHVTDALQHLEEIHTNHLAELRFVVSQPRPYKYTDYDDPEVRLRNMGPSISEGYFTALNPLKLEIKRYDHYAKVDDARHRMDCNEDKSPKAIVPDARIALNETYELIRAILRVHNSKLTMINIDQAPGKIRMLAQRKLDILGKQERPPEVATYMRTVIPRFTWNTHDCPSDLVPEEYASQLQHYWTPANARDANYLIHPDDIAQSKAPLHHALEVADIVAADGYTDEAYAIRAHVIDTGLQIDFDRSDPEPGISEFPFMQYIFASAITGELGMSKQAHFDYADAFNTFMGETWDRLIRETDQGTAGPATAFIHNFFTRYDEEDRTVEVQTLAPYMARSLLQTNAKTQPDVVGALRALQRIDETYAGFVLAEIDAMPARPVITNTQAAELANEVLAVSHVQLDPSAAFDANLAAASQDADIYSFKTAIATAGPTKIVVGGDIDLDAHIAYATVEYRTPDGTLTLSIHANLASGEIVADTVEGTALDATTAELYRDAIRAAIAKHTAAAIERQAVADATRITQTGELQRASSAPVQASAQERTTLRDKTRGIANPSMATAEPAAEESSGETMPSSHITVGNATLESVAEYMSEQKLVGIHPQRILNRLADKLRQSNEGGAAFGKPSFIEKMQGSDDVKLRQLGWITDSGRQIRLYFEVKPGGHMELCGIYDKKGGQHQYNYISKLVKRLSKQSNIPGTGSNEQTNEPHGKRRNRK